MSWLQRGTGLIVPGHAVTEEWPTAVDLFAGAGGFSCGFHRAGWHVVAALEWDRDATATYLCNLGCPDTVVHFTDGRPDEPAGPTAGTGWISSGRCDENFMGELDYAGVCTEPVLHFWHGDATKVTGAEILDALGMERGELGCVMGGPPCQGFSMAGKREVMDPRNSLVFEFGRLVLELEPMAFVMENVPGMLRMVTPEGLNVVDALALMLADGGFAPYKALRRSLGLMPNARGAVRSARQNGDEDEDPDELGGPEQLDLLAGVS